MEVLIFLVVAGCIALWVKSSNGGGGGGGELDALVAQHSATLDYRYKSLLGIDAKGGRVFALGLALGKDEIRSVEKSSIMETKSNAWGYQFHKEKQCKLIIHTRSLQKPMITVPFGSKPEMDEWYARLGVFCALS